MSGGKNAIQIKLQSSYSSLCSTRILRKKETQQSQFQIDLNWGVMAIVGTLPTMWTTSPSTM